jgi:hypothetical protein
MPGHELHAIGYMMRRGLSADELIALYESPSPDYKKTRIRAHGDEYFVSVGDVYCLVSHELVIQLTGAGFVTPTPAQIHGIGCDATFLVFGGVPQYRSWDIVPEARELARRLMDFFPHLPQDTKPYPVTVDISDAGDFLTTVSKSKRVKHA